MTRPHVSHCNICSFTFCSNPNKKKGSISWCSSESLVLATSQAISVLSNFCVFDILCLTFFFLHFDQSFCPRSNLAQACFDRISLIHLNQQCSCVDSLSACVSTFHSDHSSPQTSGCSCVRLRHLHRHHTFRTKKLPILSPLGCWLLSTAADDECALATVGSGKCGTELGGALTLSPLPTCNGRQRLQEP